MREIKKFIRSWGIPITCALLVILTFQCVLMIGYVPSSSMEPTIQKNSYIIGLRLHGELQRGDIVIFKMGDMMMVKRIAAIPGDIVYVKGLSVWVNGDPEDADKIIEVPDGHFYMLGDNTYESFDSRYWGENPFVKEKDILARLFIR